MSSRFNKDYLALQNLWYSCSHDFIEAYKFGDPAKCMRIIDVFHASLVNVIPPDATDENTKSLHHQYEQWLVEEWIPLCKKKLAEWAKQNPFESHIDDNKVQEFDNIKEEYTIMRFHKIMQIIQDSGIGLGQGSKDVTEYFMSQE